MAQLFGFKEMNHMSCHLRNETCEMKGMVRERFIGDEVISRSGLAADTFHNSGYRFKFKDGNNLRFDMSQFSAVVAAATGGDSDDS
jgi:NOL1/NOP2/fmu family ribosome biogenesis protein